MIRTDSNQPTESTIIEAINTQDFVDVPDSQIFEVQDFVDVPESEIFETQDLIDAFNASTTPKSSEVINNG